MTPSKNCTDLIRKYEGEVLRVYPDPKTGGEPYTAGVGHTGPDVHPGMNVTQAMSDAWLQSDVAKAAGGVTAALNGAKTTQGQFDALVSFAFNIGLRKAIGSTLWRMHTAGDYTGAAGQFGLWINKGTPVEKGLRLRRAAEARLYKGLPA